MDSRVRELNRVLRDYDKDLFVRRDGAGTIHLYRKKPIVVWHKWRGMKIGAVVVKEQYIQSLTHNWKLDGEPVEWGQLPLMERLRDIDGWTNQNDYEEFCKRRERRRADKERMLRNDFHARAADLRRDFAKATNDIRVAN